jgi:hypothetical protein
MIESRSKLSLLYSNENGMSKSFGSHQLRAQEMGQFGRQGLKPIVFVLNNSGYLIERLLCKIRRSPITTERHGVIQNCHMR